MPTAIDANEEIPTWTIAYICAHCGCIERTSIEILDSGTTLTCEQCGEATIVDLSKPKNRVGQFGSMTSQWK